MKYNDDTNFCRAEVFNMFKIIRFKVFRLILDLSNIQELLTKIPFECRNRSICVHEDSKMFKNWSQSLRKPALALSLNWLETTDKMLRDM